MISGNWWSLKNLPKSYVWKRHNCAMCEFCERNQNFDYLRIKDFRKDPYSERVNENLASLNNQDFPHVLGLTERQKKGCKGVHRKSETIKQAGVEIRFFSIWHFQKDLRAERVCNSYPGKNWPTSLQLTKESQNKLQNTFIAPRVSTYRKSVPPLEIQAKGPFKQYVRSNLPTFRPPSPFVRFLNRKNFKLRGQGGGLRKSLRFSSFSPI